MRNKNTKMRLLFTVIRENYWSGTVSEKSRLLILYMV